MVKQIALAPLPETAELYEAIEEEIIRVFKKLIYEPIVREFTTPRVLNAKNPVVEALLSGRITFNRGVFSGKFNATLSRHLRELGARWDRTGGCFRISINDLPEDLRVAVSTTRQVFTRKLEAIDRRLSQISPEEISGAIQTQKSFDTSLFEMDQRVQRSLKKVSGVLQVGAKLTPAERRAISEEWQNNMDLWIQDFTKKEIRELRSRLLESALRGNRYESAVRTIQRSYQVTRNKAKFLASQETRLMLCKFKAARYQEAGVRYYRWKCVTGTSKHPVRPRHRELNNLSEKGKLFRFDQPPISTAPNEPTRHCNPGEDYNCRCVAIPVVDFSKP